MTPQEILKLTSRQAAAFSNLLTRVNTEYRNAYSAAKCGSVEERKAAASMSKTDKVLHGMQLHAGLFDNRINGISRAYHDMEAVYDTRRAVVESMTSK